MTTEIEWTYDFFVPGLPAPGGSKTAFVPRRKNGSFVLRPNGSPVVNMTDSGGVRNKNWRNVVAVMAKQSMRGASPSGLPCFWRFNFFMPRAQAEFRANGELKEWAKKYHTSAPDCLKLCRSTEDALTNIIWIDDAQVVSQNATKEYIKPGQESGCRIRIKFIS